MGGNQRKAHKSVDFKLQAVQDILENGRSVAQVAEEFGVGYTGILLIIGVMLIF